MAFHARLSGKGTTGHAITAQPACRTAPRSAQGGFKVAYVVDDDRCHPVQSTFVDFVLSSLARRKYQRRAPPAARKAPRSSRAAGRAPLFALRAPAPHARPPAARPSLGEPQGGERQHQRHGVICLWMRSISSPPCGPRCYGPAPTPLVTLIHSSSFASRPFAVSTCSPFASGKRGTRFTPSSGSRARS